MEEPKTKCPKCRCWRNNEDYIKKNKVLKTCENCRENGKKSREPKNEEPKNEEPNDPTSYIRHQRLFRKLNNEFLQRSAKPVHIYKMKHVFVDIRDHRIYSDKEFSNTNY